MKIKLYKDLSDSFDLIECEEGKTIIDSFPDVKDWNKYLIFVNGKNENENHIINDFDNIFIRAIPFSSWKPKDYLLTVLTFGYYGIVKAGKDAYEEKKKLEKIEKELKKIRGITKDDVLNLPYLKGASNSIATGNSQPYIIGTHIFTPYILNASKSGKSSRGFHEISGENGTKQFLNRVYEIGFSKQILQKISIGDIDLIKFGKDKVFEGVFYFDNKAFTSADSFCEISQEKRFQTEIFNKKIVEVEKNDSLKMADDKDYKDLIYVLEPNSRAADICIMFNGLMMYNEEGIKGNRTRNIIPSYSYDYAELAKSGRENEAHWINFNFDKLEWIPERRTEEIGRYEYIFWEETKPNFNDIWIHKNSWTFKNGVDIRNNYDACDGNIAVHLRGSKGKPVAWVAKITLKKINVVPGHFGNVIKTTKFSGQFNTQIRFNAHIDFDFNSIFENGEKKYSQPITLKLSTPDKKLEKGQDVSDCYVQWIHSYIFDKTESKKAGHFIDEKIIEDEALKYSCLLGVHLEATTENKELTDSLQVITSGVARVFEKDENDNYYLSSQRVKTSNPAAWWCEVLTSRCHNPSRYEDDEIDLDTFGKWFDYCEEKGFTVDYVITQGKTKASILEMIRECGRGSTYTNIFGKIAVAFDDVIENASGLLNEQNMISFSYEKDMKRKIDGLSVKYIDSENGFQENEIVVMYDGSINPEYRNADSVLKQVSFDGITTWQNAYRKALYLMKCDKLRPKKCIANVGEEGYFYSPFSKFLIQHPALKIGLGNSEIKNIILDEDERKIIGLELYDSIELDEENKFNVVIQCITENYCTPISKEIKGFRGRTKEIEFVEPISVNQFVRPHKDDILSYGYEVETVTDEMIVSNVEESDKGYKITLYDYDERIFEEVSDFPDYEANLTEPKNNSGSLPSSLPSPTIADVNNTIEKAIERIDMSIVESPNVYAELTSCGFSVNDEGTSPIAQSIKTTVHVIQEMKEIDFVFGEIKLPEGFKVSIDYHTLTFTVEEGRRISTGIINIPVIFRKLIHDNFYSDENEIYYSDDEKEVYGEYDFDTELTYYNLGVNYAGIQGGKQLGPYKSVSEIPTENVVIGDYFVYLGNSTDDFKQCGVYAWNGLRWEKDESAEHTASTMGDMLGVANADLEKNNSRAYEYLEHLTANSIFVDKLVANTAFIDSLIAKDIYANKIKVVSEKADSASSKADSASSKADSASSKADSASSKADTASSKADTANNRIGNQTIIEGGKILSNLIDVEKLFANQITLKNPSGQNNFIQSEGFSDSSKNGFQIKANGDCIFRGLSATNGTFENISVKNSTFDLQCTINGCLNNFYIETTKQTEGLISYKGTVDKSPFHSLIEIRNIDPYGQVGRYDEFYYDTAFKTKQRFIYVSINRNDFVPILVNGVMIYPKGTVFNLQGYKNENGGVFLKNVLNIDDGKFWSGKICVDSNGNLKLI